MRMALYAAGIIVVFVALGMFVAIQDPKEELYEGYSPVSLSDIATNTVTAPADTNLLRMIREAESAE